MGISTLITREVARDKSLAAKYLHNSISIKLILIIIATSGIILTINLLNYPTGTIIVVYIIGLAFALSAGFAGIAGGLLGYLNRYISPHLFEFPTSVLIITMIVVGGLGNTKGAIAGAAMLLILSEALRGFGDYRLIIYSIMILLCLSFSPQGLVGITKNLWSFLQHKFKFEKFASTKFHLNK